MFDNFIGMLVRTDDYFFNNRNTAKLVLNYGCGNRKEEKEIGVDVSHNTMADYVLTEGHKLPYSNDYFDFAYSRYVLEHVDNIYEVINEVGRTLKSGASYKFVVPHAYSIDAFDDPTHVRYFTLNTAKYFAGTANIHYSNSVFSLCRSYIKLSLALPRVKFIRYPINVLLGSVSYFFPKLSEQLLKLPFLTAALYFELVKT